MRKEMTVTDTKKLVRIVRKETNAIGEKFDEKTLKKEVQYYLDHGGLPIWKVIVGSTQPANLTGKWMELPDINLKEDWSKNLEGDWEITKTVFRDSVQVWACVPSYPRHGTTISSVGGGWEVHTSVIRGDTIPPEDVHVYEVL